MIISTHNQGRMLVFQSKHISVQTNHTSSAQETRVAIGQHSYRCSIHACDENT